MSNVPSIQRSFVVQMRDFFGLLPGQSTMQFAAELRVLSEEEKREYGEMLTSAGFPCEVQQRAAVA